jgi:hypothetical protein
MCPCCRCHRASITAFRVPCPSTPGPGNADASIRRPACPFLSFAFTRPLPALVLTVKVCPSHPAPLVPNRAEWQPLPLTTQNASLEHALAHVLAAYRPLPMSSECRRSRNCGCGKKPHRPGTFRPHRGSPCRRHVSTAHDSFVTIPVA